MPNFGENITWPKADKSEDGQEIEDELEDKEEIEKAQREVEKLVKELDILKFSDNLEMLNWCMKMQEVSDVIGVSDKVPREEIVNKFSEHGITPRMNVGRKDLRNDEDAWAKYIIGQAISDIQKDGYVKQAIYSQVNKWKEEFNKEDINNNEINEEKKYKNEEEFLKVVKEKSIEEAVLYIDEYRGLSQDTFNKILKSNQRLVGVLYANLLSFTNLKAFDYNEKSYPLFRKGVKYKSSSIETAFEKTKPENVLKGINNGAFDNPLYSSDSASLIAEKGGLPGLEFVAANIDNLKEQFSSWRAVPMARKLIENDNNKNKMSEIVLNPSLFEAVHNSRGVMGIMKSASPENSLKMSKFFIDNLDVFKNDFNLVQIRTWTTRKERASVIGPDYRYYQNSSVERFPKWTELAEALINAGAQDLLKENLAKFSNEHGSLSKWEVDFLIKEFEEAKKKESNQETASV